MADDDPTQLRLVKLTTAVNGLQASMLVGALEAASVRATLATGTRSRREWAARSVYVAERDLGRAREVMSAKPMSEDELVKAEEESTRELTKPRLDDHIRPD
jgi:hypothetical protein